METIDGADVWVVQGRSKFRFALKASKISRLVGEFMRQDFDDDGPIQSYIKGSINRSLAALPELVKNSII